MSVTSVVIIITYDFVKIFSPFIIYIDITNLGAKKNKSKLILEMRMTP